MNIRTKSALVLSSVALGATGILSAAPASGSANRVLWTSNRAGSININWTWHSSADGKTY